MQVLYTLEALRSPVWDAVLSLLTRLGGQAVVIGVALLLFWCVDRRRGLYLLTAVFAGALLGQVLKLAFHIPRPWVLDPDFTIVESARAAAVGYSFPSGHSINAAALYGGLARSTQRRWVRAGLVLLSCLVPFTRMYLGVHTPLDVGTGFALGWALALSLYPLFRRFGGDDRALTRCMAVLLAASALCLCAALFWRRALNVDAENLRSGIRNCWTLAGGALGLLLAGWRFGFQFSERARLPAQLAKLALGILVTMLLVEGPKYLLPMLPDGPLRGFRYALGAFFIAGLWPRCFPRLSNGQSGKNFFQH